MANENIARFFDTAMTDRALAAKLAVLAAEHGYGFTAEELLELGAIRPISDEGAEKIGGGYSWRRPSREFSWPECQLKSDPNKDVYSQKVCLGCKHRIECGNSCRR